MEGDIDGKGRESKLAVSARGISGLGLWKFIV
jgi:hypothetical protein